MASISSIEFLEIQENIECEFTLTCLHGMIKTYSQMHHTDKYSELSSIIWSVWPNGWVFVYELSGCGFASRCIILNFSYSAYFQQGVAWHSGKYRVWIHSDMHTWHEKKIQSNAPYREVLTTQLNHLVSSAKWFSIRWWTKWLRFRVSLHFFKLQISRLFPASCSLAFRQI